MTGRRRARRGEYGELKTKQLKALLTPLAKELLEERAFKLNISVGELLERFARGQLGK